MLVHESYETLVEQVAALAAGTNPVVYFPVGTKRFPFLPGGAEEVILSGDADGCGTYYFLPAKTSEDAIRAAVAGGYHWKLLGIVQCKEEIMRGAPLMVMVRNSGGLEVKGVAVDARNVGAVLSQAVILQMQFPRMTITIEQILDVIRDRMAA